MALHNALKLGMAVKLIDWLKKNKEPIESGQYSKATAAALATKELGFNVTGNNIDGVRKIAKVRFMTGGNERVRASACVDGLVIVEAVIGLYLRLGETVPSNLIEVKARLEAIAAKIDSIRQES